MQRIRVYGDSVLRKTALQVEVFDDRLRSFIDEMTETMLVADGVGLAANQVGEALQVAVIDTTGGEQPAIVLVNPVITEKSDDIEEADEGCLSVPGITLPVKRPARVTVEAVDQFGKPYCIKDASGLLARALQHEIDHLNGILFIDHVSALQRTMVSGKLKKLAKTGSAD
jgi:peptide deformylase